MRAPIWLILLVSLLSSLSAQAVNDLGVVVFDPWPLELPTPGEGGVPIRWAVPGSPAAAAGIKPGDVIVSIDMFTVSTADLAHRWQDKTTGAAGCIPMDVLRTNLQPKGWKHVAVCVPVKAWSMPSDAKAKAAEAVPLVTISGAVEKPGTYLTGKRDLSQLLKLAEPHTLPSVLGCFLPSGPEPLPADDCVAPADPLWKKLPKNRSYTIAVYDHPPEVPRLADDSNNSGADTVTASAPGGKTRTVTATTEARDGGH